MIINDKIKLNFKNELKENKLAFPAIIILSVFVLTSFLLFYLLTTPIKSI